MRHRRRAWCIAGLLAGAVSCGGGASRSATGEHSQGSAQVGGQVISTVHGFAITVADVQSLVDASDLSPREALRRLQAEQLLMGAAEERGFERDSEVSRVKRQAAVQALLDQVANTASVSDEELRAAYDKAGPRFRHPELRAAVHVLARLPKDASPEADAAAKAYAQKVIPELARAENPAAFVKALDDQKEPEFTVVGEVLPPLPNGATLEASFMTELYAAKGEVVVGAPVRTSYGWHAMRVVQIIPEKDTPVDEAAKELRPAMLRERRAKLVDELIEHARKRQPPRRPDNVNALLAALPP